MSTATYTRELDEERVLRTLIESTSSVTGTRFLYAIVENLSKALGTEGAWLTVLNKEKRTLKALAFLMKGEWFEDYEYDFTGTICEEVVMADKLVHYPDNIMDIYPHSDTLRSFKAVSFMGAPLKDVDGTTLGYLSVLDTRPIPADDRLSGVFNIFAERAVAELRRLRAEQRLREREEKLSSLLDSAMDSIIEIDSALRVNLVNSAAEKLFGFGAGALEGNDFARFLAKESRDRLSRLIKELETLPDGRKKLWIHGGLSAVTADGSPFEAEATLSAYEIDRKIFYTLILRSVSERLEARRQISSLMDAAKYLEEEIVELGNYDEIIGRSPAMAEVLEDVRKVAGTDATVLILGETGTGKEVIARAIHRASTRSGRPMIKVNCAAIPGSLIESEFFGHEAGAFTGATKKRVGRFAAADGGTIFLDEIGELPLGLQSKLLRALQEGEFEPVGSSRTVRVDVRVLAATNRDLRRSVEKGEFREDLYYRLNVFPIGIPPLRERRDDVGLFARFFARKFTKRMGREINPLTDDCIEKLLSYHWPGNVRELQNVIERAVITSPGGALDLGRALPETVIGPGGASLPPAKEAATVYRLDELAELERSNIRKALEAARGRIYGQGGAAELLGMNPSTLRSRMKTLGIKKP
ncbi:MAG: sigma 54-interacting transcriptional regulator [Candidatus Dadabacteria bacterium]|nr:sigma 54-interacting transcriptional regulator [Candidatus Dadabacteria bacterium]